MEELPYNSEYSSALFVGENYQKKGGEDGMMDIVEIKVVDMILLLFNLALILIRLHMLEKRVKELEGR